MEKINTALIDEDIPTFSAMQATKDVSQILYQMFLTVAALIALGAL